MVYITEELLNNINESVVRILKTSYNYVDVVVSAGEATLKIGPFLPDTEPDLIKIPILSSVEQQQFAYENIDVIRVENDPILSAYPTSCSMNFYGEGDIESGTSGVVSGMSVNECMIYAISNGIIKQLLDDNKLLYNGHTSAFRWELEERSTTIIFYNHMPESSYVFEIDKSVIGHINFVNVMFKRSDETIWKNGDFIFDSELRRMTIKIPNIYNYQEPQIRITIPSENYKEVIIPGVFPVPDVEVDITYGKAGTYTADIVHFQYNSSLDQRYEYDFKIFYCFS